MTEWVRNNPDQVKAEEPDKVQIEEFYGVAVRELGDARSVISPEGRLTHAYTACLGIASAALLVLGYRVRNSRGHHYKRIESLEHTIGFDHDDVRRIQTYRTDRHESMYEIASKVSEAKADHALQTAESLLESFKSWILENSPELAPPSIGS